jgi:glycosyltransferase involved in cell wall biosynthesis
VTDDARGHTTIVIPVWDDYVALAVDDAVPSLLAQEVPAAILVVDNASTIAVPERPDVTVIRSSERLPLGAARNLGLEHAQTRYVVMWDADDVMLPGTLAFLESTMESSPQLAAFGMAIVEDSGSRHRWPRQWVSQLARHPRALALVHSVWSVFPTTGATIMRTDLLRAGGGYSEAESGDDWVAGVSLVFRGRVAWSERPGRVYRRVHDTSIWSRHMAPGYQLRHAGTVRRRLRQDPAVPGWVKALIPLVGAAQYGAIGAHELVAALRRVRSPA